MKKLHTHKKISQTQNHYMKQLFMLSSLTLKLNLTIQKQTLRAKMKISSLLNNIQKSLKYKKMSVLFHKLIKRFVILSNHWKKLKSSLVKNWINHSLLIRLLPKSMLKSIQIKKLLKTSIVFTGIITMFGYIDIKLIIFKIK